MSLASKATLATACGMTFGTIGYVHYKQQYDRDRLHDGVIRDAERRKRRQVINTYNLQQQIGLTKELQKQKENETNVS